MGRIGVEETGKITVRSERENIFCDKSVNIRYGKFVTMTEKPSAQWNGDGEVDVIAILGGFLRNDKVRDDHLTEIVHDESGEYFFLSYAVGFFGMKNSEPDCVF